MKSLLVFLVIGITCITLQAQGNYNTKSMVVSQYDLSATTYPKDSTANAFYIYEKGYSRIQNGKSYNLLTDYERKIKILNEDGYEQANIEIYLYKNKSNKEKINQLTAHTYNIEDGKVVRAEVAKSYIFKTAYSEHFDVVRFTFPNIKPGSVIRYSYQLESPFTFNFNGWDFQDEIPKLYSEYVTDLPGNYLYNIRLVGHMKLKTNESDLKKRCLETSRGYSNCSHNKYVMVDIPAFKEEEYMTAKKNYFSRVAYELKEFKGFDGRNTKYTDTWKNVDRKLKKENNIGLQLKKINSTKEVLPTDIQSMPTALEKAKKIYRYITEAYTWNKAYNLFRDTDLKEVLKTKTGNVGSINTLLHNTLKQQGFIVHPVLISTRENGYATKLHPVLSDFNYLIVQLTLDNKTYLLDATDTQLAFGQVPYRCLNQYGRQLDFDTASEWIDIVPKQRSSNYYKEVLELTTDDKISSTAEFLHSGYDALEVRNQLTTTNEDTYLGQLLPQTDEIEITTKEIAAIDALDKPIIEKISYNYDVQFMDDMAFIKPFNRPFFTKNPFKLNERTYPVDFGYTRGFAYNVTLTIPDGYNFIDIPKNTSYALPDQLGRLVTSFAVKENTITINHFISFTTSYYATVYYEAIKSFFNHIVDIEENTVITIKKS